MFLSSDISCYLISLGCSKNLVDSERINGALISSGFRISDDPESADIIIINTCGFIEDAKKESIDVIFEAIGERDLVRIEGSRKRHREGRYQNAPFKRRVVVVGCLSQRYYDILIDEIPEIDLLYGIFDDNFLTVLSEAFDIELIKRGNPLRVPLDKNAAYSYIKISEGCSNNCSYCAIPLIRGPSVSFSVESIVEDSIRAVENGSLELIFIAQDTTSYSFKGYRLPHLIDLVSKIEGVKWIRLLYFHPDRLGDDIIDLVRDNDKIVKYIDLPFQHVNSRILKSMGRDGSTSQYTALIDRLRGSIPGIRIRSTFMVGYPGETERDFDELIEFISTVKLDRVGCFTYSREDNTRAALLGDDVPEGVKNQRYNILMETQRVISEERLNELIGKELEVLIEEQVDNGSWLGRTEYDAPEVDGIFFLTAQNVSIRSIVRARVTNSTEYDLIGVLS
jgi:ribosomal protein S12 methylthiotransferase